MQKVPRNPVLIVDDEVSWIESMKAALEYECDLNNIITCSDSRKVLEILSHVPCSLVLLDINMPFMSGNVLLPQIVAEFPNTQVLIVSGMNKIDLAVDCVKRGAYTYIIKSSDLSQIVISVKNALAMQGLVEENQRIRDQLFEIAPKNPEVFARIRTQSCKMASIFRYCESLELSSEPILITGESGTGKELIAQTLHEICRPCGPFVSLNVAGLDDTVFSDTLFGHVKGAYTGAVESRKGLVEKASQGTLFLDEIGDLSRESQVKLLRLLQEGEYYPLGSDTTQYARTRFVFATNDQLHKKVSDGRFRKDLFYRLNTHHIKLPPLRDRLEDLQVLTVFFAAEAAKSMSMETPVIPPQLVAMLKRYTFPGNIRELRSMIFDAVTHSYNGHISVDTFRDKLNTASFQEDVPCQLVPVVNVIFSGSLPTLKEMGAILVKEALARENGNHRKASELLGISRSALSKRLSKV